MTPIITIVTTPSPFNDEVCGNVGMKVAVDDDCDGDGTALLVLGRGDTLLLMLGLGEHGWYLHPSVTPGASPMKVVMPDITPQTTSGDW